MGAKCVVEEGRHEGASGKGRKRRTPAKAPTPVGRAKGGEAVRPRASKSPHCRYQSSSVFLPDAGRMTNAGERRTPDETPSPP